jgi:DNA polymerase-1
MEAKGIYLDAPFLNAMSKEFVAQIALLEEQIHQFAKEPFNINSPKQLGEILFDKLALPCPKKRSTNASVLEGLSGQYPIAKKVLEYRSLEKLRSTYIDTLPEEVHPVTKRIHCSFNQFVAATGRLSCQDPNLQNIPVRSAEGIKIRQAFRPERADWSFLSADYSQIELRLLAHFSDDPNLIKAFSQGDDVHTFTASLVFGIHPEQVTKEQRYQAKAVNFGILYGQQAFGLSKELGISVPEANHFIDKYFERFSKVRDFIETCKTQAHATGKAVTITGRERLLPDIHSSNIPIKSAAERLAVNTPIQGTQADLIKMAMLRVFSRIKEEKLQGFMILQIHDELIFELPDVEIEKFTQIVRQEMQQIYKLKVPLIVDISVGKNWKEC